MNFWIIILFLAGAFILQFVFGVYQIKNFSKTYTPLRRMGKVAIGRCTGRVKAGAIVMFAIDDCGTILTAKKMQGVTALAKFKTLKGFDGKNVGLLSQKDVVNLNSQLRKAILDAAINYNIVMSGGEIPEKPSPFKKIELSAKKLITQK